MEIIATLTSFEYIIGYYLICFISLTLLSWKVFFAPTRGRAICTVMLWCICLGLGWSIAKKLAAVPKVQHTSPTAQTIIPFDTPEITITFDTPVDFAKLAVNISPATTFSLKHHTYMTNKLTFGRRITIYPDTTFPHDEPIMIYLSRIEGPLTDGYGGEHLIEYKPPTMPTITGIQPDPTNGKDIQTNTVFTVRLSHPTSHTSEWTATIDPPHPLNLTFTDNTTFDVSPQQPLQQGTAYTLSLIQTPTIVRYRSGEVMEKRKPHTEKTIRFATTSPPNIKTFTPQGTTTLPQENIRIIFDQPMNRTSVENLIAIEPKISTNYVWEQSNQVVTLTHQDFAKNTEYTVTLPKGIRTARDSTLTQDSVYRFKTAGYLTITDTSPRQLEKDVNTLLPIKITFNQDIIATQAATFVTITPPVQGTFQVQGKNVLFLPTHPLPFATSYIVTINPGLESMHGLPLQNKQTISFVTQPEETALAVPYHRQESAFTCNIAAARMLLAFRGIVVDEKKLVEQVGTSGTRGNGNPHKGYVTDYGTYIEPIQKILSLYRKNRVISSGKLEDVIQEIKKKNPVMIWGQNGWSDPHDISWTATDGTYIRAINGMHSSVVRGFQGPSDKPTMILLNDPWRGQYAITPEEFLRRWSFLSVALVID